MLGLHEDFGRLQAKRRGAGFEVSGSEGGIWTGTRDGYLYETRDMFHHQRIVSAVFG